MKHETMTKLNILQTTMILKLIIVHPHQDVSLSLIEVIKPIVDPSHKHHHLLPSESHLSYIYLYNFLPPAMTVHYQERLVFDLVGMIGSVGGTLGMCIGFSFSGITSDFLNFLKSKVKTYF